MVKQSLHFKRVAVSAAAVALLGASGVVSAVGVDRVSVKVVVLTTDEGVSFQHVKAYPYYHVAIDHINRQIQGRPTYEATAAGGTRQRSG